MAPVRIGVSKSKRNASKAAKELKETAKREDEESLCAKSDNHDDNSKKLTDSAADDPVWVIRDFFVT